jgi:hypothetical protein
MVIPMPRNEQHRAAAKTLRRTSETTEAVNPATERSARIVVMTDDPHQKVTIRSHCHIDSFDDNNAYFFEGGNTLVGMLIEGGTVDYHAAKRTYIVRLGKFTHH